MTSQDFFALLFLLACLLTAFLIDHRSTHAVKQTVIKPGPK
jgi:hypothetical protein